MSIGRAQGSRPHVAAHPPKPVSLAKLKAAQKLVERGLFKAGANGVGIGPGRLNIYLPKNDAAIRKAINALMHSKAPEIPFKVTVIGVVRPE